MIKSTRKGLSITMTKNGFRAVLYKTTIVTRNGDKITLNSGSWLTRHTKNCINDLLPSGYHVYQKAFKWYLHAIADGTLCSENEFIDGMTFTVRGQK